MLQDATVRIVKATAGILRERALDITRRFYAILFESYPEVRSMFNQSHQRDGSQPRALANSLIAYAEHIDNLEALTPLVEQVAQKHVSLHVKPEQYEAVGSCLLRAMREVLGQAATDEVIDAWAEAYQFLADILINAESAIYRANERTEGGWRGPRQFYVAHKERVTDSITSFYLAPVDEEPIMDFTPGQFITVQVTVGGRLLQRNYSLSDAPGRSYYRISVKRERDGEVSRYLHDHVDIGASLSLLPPSGEFRLRQNTRPLLLISGGVGVTPMISMLNHTIGSGRRIVFVHAARTPAEHAFRGWIEHLQARDPHLVARFVTSRPEPGNECADAGRIDKDFLAAYVPADANVEVYIVGPVGFMRDTYQAFRALGVPQEQLHYEFFGPTQAIEGQGPSQHREALGQYPRAVTMDPAG